MSYEQFIALKKQRNPYSFPIYSKNPLQRLLAFKVSLKYLMLPNFYQVRSLTQTRKMSFEPSA